jgi:ribosomal protein S27AE
MKDGKYYKEWATCPDCGKKREGVFYNLDTLKFIKSKCSNCGFKSKD